MNTDPGPSLTIAPPPHRPAFDADTTLYFLDGFLRRRLNHVLAVVTLVVYGGYLVYRGLFTLNPDALTFSLVVLGAEAHGFLSMAFYFHQLWALRGRRVPPAQAGLRVDVFITTYNEDVDLLRQTARGALKIRYPHRTFILDDGRRPEVRALAAELGCEYVTRTTNEHAKAGNVNNAFRETDADFIAIFDADHVPRPAFLDRTLGFFSDPKVAFVQVPQQFHNLDSVQHRVDWANRRLYGEQDVFFKLVMPGKDHWNAAFFCGTGAVLRRAALAPHGGIVTGTITEDLHTSIVLHSEGWKSVFLDEVLVTGLAPMDLKSFEVQRLRWAEGNLRTVGFINPLTAPGLTLAQRINYFASLYHWTIGVPKLIFYLAPPWMLFSGTFPIANFNGRFMVLYAMFMITLLGGYKAASRGRARLFMDELFNMVSFFTLIRAMKRIVVGRRKPAKFEVTAKKGSGLAAGQEVLPHLALLGFSIMALSWSALGLGFGVSEDAVGAGVASFWTIYNMMLMAGAIRLALRPAQKRQSCRFRSSLPVERIDGEQAEVVGLTAEVSEHGCTLLWPTPLAPGTRLDVRFHAGPLQIERHAEIVSAHRARQDGWCGHGVKFVDLDQAQVDEMNDALFSLVVPDLFATLQQPSWWLRLRRDLRRRYAGLFAQRERRNYTAVPVRISDGQRTFLTATQDVSTSGLGVVAPFGVEPGAQLRIEVLSPTAPRLALATVVRSVRREEGHTVPTWRWGLSLERTDARADAPAARLGSAA